MTDDYLEFNVESIEERREERKNKRNNSSWEIHCVSFYFAAYDVTQGRCEFFTAFLGIYMLMPLSASIC